MLRPLPLHLMTITRVYNTAAARRGRATAGTALALAAALLALGGSVAAAPPAAITMTPAMTRGPAAAPVTIVEFSDYQ
jgi:protein-disulfide isomerase